MKKVFLIGVLSVLFLFIISGVYAAEDKINCQNLFLRIGDSVSASSFGDQLSVFTGSSSIVTLVSIDNSNNQAEFAVFGESQSRWVRVNTTTTLVNNIAIQLNNQQKDSVVVQICVNTSDFKINKLIEEEGKVIFGIPSTSGWCRDYGNGTVSGVDINSGGWNLSYKLDGTLIRNLIWVPEKNITKTNHCINKGTLIPIIYSCQEGYIHGNNNDSNGVPIIIRRVAERIFSGGISGAINNNAKDNGYNCLEDGSVQVLNSSDQTQQPVPIIIQTAQVDFNNNLVKSQHEVQIIPVSSIQNQQCNGCLQDSKCMPYGIRQAGNYCGTEGSFESQLNLDSVCDNNYECKSNECSNNKCVSTIGLLEKISGWLKSLFGFKQ